MEYMTQSYAQRQAALEQAKAAFLQAGGQIVVLETTRSQAGANTFNATFTEPKPPSPRGRPGDEALARQLTAEAAAGYCITQAAKRLELHPSAVKRVARLFQITFPAGQHPNPDAARAALAAPKNDEQDAERIRAMASVGVTISQVARQMGYGRTRVQRIADLYYITFRPGCIREPHHEEPPRHS